MATQLIKQNILWLLNRSTRLIIIPESEGSISELNAFIQYESLKEKIICLLFDAPKKASSYLDFGPVKRLRKETGRVYKIDSSISIPDLHTKIMDSLESIEVIDKKDTGLNAFLSENFILPAIYLLEPLPLNIAVKLFEFASTNGNSKLTTDISIKIMIEKRLVSMTHQGVVFSDNGFQYFMNYKSGRKSNFNKLNQLRIQLLNHQYRNKQIIMG